MLKVNILTESFVKFIYKLLKHFNDKKFKIYSEIQKKI